MRKRILGFCIIVFLLMNVGNGLIGSDKVQAVGKGLEIELLKGKDTVSVLYTNDDGFWYPGKSIIKQVYIKNTNEKECHIQGVNVTSDIKMAGGEKLAVDTLQYESFVKDMRCRITEGKSTIFEGDLKKLMAEGINCNKNFVIAANDTKNYEVTVWLEASSQNATQGIQADVSVNMSYKFDDDSTGILGKTGGFFDFKLLVVMGGVMMCIGVAMRDKAHNFRFLY